MKYAFYCPRCKSYWQSDTNSEASVDACHNCGARPLFTGYTADAWTSLSKEDKARISSVLDTRTAQNRQEPAASVHKSSIWIRIIRTMSWISFSVIVLSAIITSAALFDEKPLVALLVLIGAILVGLVSIAFIMMLTDMADDIKAIRIRFTKQEP